MSQFRDLADRIKTDGTSDEMWMSATQCLDHLGVSKVVYLDASSKAEPVVLSNACEDWAFAYKTAVLTGQDPFARQCLSTVMSQRTGIAHLETYKHLSQPELDEIARGSAALGILTGLSVTLRRDTGGAGIGFNLLTICTVAEFARLRAENELIWRAWCQLVYAGLDDTSAVSGIQLTTRERDCLAYVADGLRTTEVAHKMGLSEGMIEQHLRKARARLGGRTRDQAVAIAIRRQLI